MHRFYLNQTGLGILYITLTIISCGMAFFLINLIDSLVFFFMDSFEFDHRYNREMVEERRLEAKRQERKRQAKQERQQHRSDWAGYESPKHEARRQQRKPDNPHKVTGVQKFKEYDFKGAKESFKKALALDYNDIATHFNIACCYSMEEEINQALFHLDKAVQLGFKDFDRIHKHDALAFLRAHDEFLAFAKDHYRWNTPPPSAPKILDAPKEDLLHPKITDPEEELRLDLDSPRREKVILTDTPKEKDASLEDTRSLLDDFFGDGEDLPPPRPTPPPSGGGFSEDVLAQLKQLAELRDMGILTEEEFQVQKKRILS